ncbi:MAG: toprim domain-containing protein [Microthrixaceae bacterium]
MSETEICALCTDERRDTHVLCVVEEPRDVIAVERTREYKGRYHVLGEAIDHLRGVGPEQLKITWLLAQVDAENITEVIICTNPNLEGEATAALYLGRVLSVPGLTVESDRQRPTGGWRSPMCDRLTLGRTWETAHGGPPCAGRLNRDSGSGDRLEDERLTLTTATTECSGTGATTAAAPVR